MTGFSADWLALREPYDGIARAGAPMQLLKAWSRDKSRLTIADLGSGTGANFRAISPHFVCPQQWILLEWDPALIEQGHGLQSAKLENNCQCHYVPCDLTTDLETAVPIRVDLVTASALIDLVSETWLDRLLDLVRNRHCALYLTLSYNGEMSWEPAEEFDDEAHRLFEEHQRRDKGFGPALGGQAVAHLHAQLSGIVGRVQTGASDWLFGPADTDIQRSLLQTIVRAGKEVDESSSAALDQWAVRRRMAIDETQSHCRVGHQDLLYLPNTKIT